MAAAPQEAESGSAPVVSADDLQLVEALCRGDEQAFAALIDQYHNPMLRLALLYVPNRAVAEEVVQDTWVGVLQGLARFEGRSSLKTWIFRILTNRARTRGEREGRSITFSALAGPEVSSNQATVDPGQFHPDDHPQWANIWVSYPQNWALPEERMLSGEIRTHIQQAIDMLSPAQREVIRLRDVEGWTSDEVCNVLGISETNQRVLLHRARAKVRRTLDQYLHEE